MRTEPILDYKDGQRGEASGKLKAEVRRFARRAGVRVLHELREALAPTIFFFVGFNLIVLTTNLLIVQYLVAVSNFILATFAALVVGKSVLVANAMPFIRRYDRAPLIWPILFKTAVYCVIVILARLLEHFVRFSILDHNPPRDFLPHMIASFSWSCFVAIQLWVMVLFLIYVTASEFSRLFGPSEVRRLLFTRRPTELQLNRRQRMRELLRLSRLADFYTSDEFRDLTSAAHGQLVDSIGRLARQPGRSDAELSPNPS